MSSVSSGPELVEARVRAFSVLLKTFPKLAHLDTRKLDYPLLSAVRREIDAEPVLFSVWQYRLTTSSHMVRMRNESNVNTIFFCHQDPFGSFEKAIEALQGKLSDGGAKYPRCWLDSTSHAFSQMSYRDYTYARGGTFTARQLLNHPIFHHVAGDRKMWTFYVHALETLSYLNYFQPGLHSGWRPGEMRIGYGRAIALGVAGEVFYPPNNSTLGHAALVIPKVNS